VFVGLGVLLAASPAMPQLAQLIGPVAIEQGRADEEGDESRSWESGHNSPYIANLSPSTEDDTDDTDSLDEVEDPLSQLPVKATLANSNPQQVRPLVRRRTLGAQTLPALPLHLQNIRDSKPKLSVDPFGQLNPDENLMPYQSSPSLVSAHTPSRVAANNRADSLLERYDAPRQVQLLRGHYYSSEVRYVCFLCSMVLISNKVQFLLSLEKISNRLVIVPKPARVSALRAELTALNHKLPDEVTIISFFYLSFLTASPRFVYPCGAPLRTILETTVFRNRTIE
jgi:hypothetical protein